MKPLIPVILTCGVVYFSSAIFNQKWINKNYDSLSSRFKKDRPEMIIMPVLNTLYSFHFIASNTSNAVSRRLARK